MKTTFTFDALLGGFARPPGVRFPARIGVCEAVREDGSPGFCATLYDLLDNPGVQAMALSPESAVRGAMLAFFGVVSKHTGTDTTDDAATAVRLTLN